MNKNLTTRECVLLALMIVFIAYYFIVHVPLTEESSELTTMQAAVDDETAIAQATLMVQQNMKRAIDDAYAAADGHPQAIPEYNNANKVILELHTILADTLSYNIVFEDEQFADSICRREIHITFATENYEQTKRILSAIDSSKNLYLIENANLTDNTLAYQHRHDANEIIEALYGTREAEQASYNAALDIVCFEYAAG